MPDDNRLDGIAQKLDDSDESDTSDDSHDSYESHDSGVSGVSDHEAPFSYDETKKMTAYGRVETIEQYKRALKLAEARLIEEHDLTHVEGREIHDAALWEGIEDPDAIADRVVEERKL